MKVRALAALLGILLGGAVAPPAVGQAWVSPQGEGYVGLGYLYAGADWHVNAEGKPQDAGSMYSSTLYLSGGYTPIERLGIWGGVSYVWTRWDRNGLLSPKGAPIIAHGPNDDERWHDALQDARFEFRYNLLEEPLLVTPLVGIVLPTHHYNTAGHAATGRGLVEAPVGLYVGRTLDPRGWTQVRYAYSFVENIKDNDTGEVLNLNRSNLDAEIGYYVSPSFSVRVLGAFQWTCGGLNVGVGPPPSDAEFHDHDRRARVNFQKVGVGTTYSAGAFDFSLVGSLTLGGENYAKVYTVAATVTWNFGRAPAESFFGTRTRPAPR